MKRYGNLTAQLISEENIQRAIEEVNRTHRMGRHHRPNRCVLWVERTTGERTDDLREILMGPFHPAAARLRTIYDQSGLKTRDIYEPKLWPDQYVHHALVQIIAPIIMRSMDYWCCGSIPGRGQKHGIRGIEKWMREDPKGTKYCAQMDIRHFYQSLTPEVVMARMEQIIKDKRVLGLIRETLAHGVPIGAYPSQWYANAVLEPLDRLIRKITGVAHYTRYMDNLTLFGPNKKKLHKAVRIIEEWLQGHGMTLKGDWQVLPTSERMPDAMGFRYGHGWTIPRKKNVLRFKRACTRATKRIRQGKQIAPSQACGLISRAGGFSHSCAHRTVEKWLYPIGVKRLKAIIRKQSRKELERARSRGAPHGAMPGAA